jgi:hypothetical protein
MRGAVQSDSTKAKALSIVKNYGIYIALLILVIFFSAVTGGNFRNRTIFQTYCARFPSSCPALVLPSTPTWGCRVV